MAKEPIVQKFFRCLPTDGSCLDQPMTVRYASVAGPPEARQARQVLPAAQAPGL